MPVEKFRASEYVRGIEMDEEIVVEKREEVGRGKRFGSDGELRLEADEAERLAKWILARDLEM